ncbi:hypothetical protein [Capnocytophaga sp. oral taxon 338]|uniref:hypothetical protein n=1 Tax=Capnocytophaga sp. oral taxon 338 TaxID=710239 RepID=UPI000202E8E7|nr:hypothetical protein [Capnocytophaga sp. oral taxon 338]EGD34866.1 hypothetical protein HMPREF9071_0558 [Capnocytophaga sp. oral taxon 338 str. F0234]
MAFICPTSSLEVGLRGEGISSLSHWQAIKAIAVAKKNYFFHFILFYWSVQLLLAVLQKYVFLNHKQLFYKNIFLNFKPYFAI